MPSITVTIVAGQNFTATLNYSAADATRILAAWQKVKINQKNATAQDIANYYSALIQRDLSATVIKAEAVTPTPPTFT